MRTVQLECIIFRITHNSIASINSFEFLLLKRIPKKGGFWQPVCGGLERSDKSKLDGAYREIQEETGIKKEQIVRMIEEVHHFVIDKDYLTNKPIPPMEEFVFGFEVNNKTNVILDKNVSIEHSEFKWVSVEDAIKLLKWEDNKIAFRKLYTILMTN